jgi:HlyD family secretion protein
LQLGEDAPALILEPGAFLDQSGGDSVFVVSADGLSATRRRIRIGRRNPGQLEILAGLAAGEQVIVSDYSGLDRVDRITIVKGVR